MPPGRWDGFVGDVTAMIECHGGTIINAASGTGYWQGQQEDTFVVTFDEGDEAALSSALGMLAYWYDQEAIALLEGETEFIAASTTTVDVRRA